MNTGGSLLQIRRGKGNHYEIEVGLARWDTSSLPDDAALSAATLRLFVDQKGDAENRALTADWYTAWPIGMEDYSEAAQTSASGPSGWDLTPLVVGADNDGALQGYATEVSRTGYTGLRLHISGGQPAGDNQIKARSRDGTGPGPRLLVTYNSPPGTPVLDSPVAGASVPSVTPVLKAVSSDADGDPIDYLFEVADDAGFTTNVRSSGWLPTTNTFTAPPGWLKDGATYYWRAQARDPSQSSAWSGGRSFAVRTLQLGSYPSWPMWSRGPASVNLANGNLVVSAPGPSYPTAAGSMAAGATFNSLDTANQGLGTGWRLDAGDGLASPPEKLVDHSLLSGAARFDAAEVVLPGGGSAYHTHVGASAVYAPPPGDTSELKKNANGTWTLLDEDGALYTFGAADPATGAATLTSAEVTDASPGEGKLTYAYSATDPTKITRITDTAGRALAFTWNALDAAGCPSAILCVGGPDGVSWRYVGDGAGGTSGRLARVNDGTRDLLAFTYDAEGRLTKVQNANDLNPAAASPGYNGAHAISIAYDGGGPPSAITVVGSASGQEAAANLLTIAKPAGTQTDDVMIAVIALRGDKSISAVPAGWTEIRNDAGGTTNTDAKMYSYRRVATASEPADHTWTLSGSIKAAGGIVTFRGVNTAAPVDVHGGATNPGPADATTNEPVEAPSVTTTVADAMLVGAFMNIRDNATSFTPPTGMTEQVDRANDGSGGGTAKLCTVEITTEQLSVSGATGTRTATAAAGRFGEAGQLIVLKTASVAPGSGRVASVSEGPVTGQSPASSTWSFVYEPGALSASPTRAAHGALPAGAARTADGYTTVTPPNQQGLPSPKSAKTFYDNLGHPMETVDLLGNVTEVAYDEYELMLWTEDEDGNPTDYAYDALDSVLLSVTAPDPDGAGSLGRPVSAYRYDETAIGSASAAGPALQGLQASYFDNQSLAGRPKARQTATRAPLAISPTPTTSRGGRRARPEPPVAFPPRPRATPTTRRAASRP